MIPRYRVWDKQTERMHFVSGIDFNDGLVSSVNIWHEGWPWELEPDEIALMQSTGLKDKNGVEIFEGDIVQWGDTPDWEEKPIRVAVVKINPDIQFDSNVGIFEYGRFIYRDTERFLTVLGNVYENSELLEEQ
ncbi:YopX family protein [Enterococcus durans]|uniref:YopX family protein n=1 Tax=Enterococcus durans TaxID=53345 RepID=UPI00101FE866|nr:YopX family protein [Enterococcus durans]MZG91108.1 hypothetical protein [Enterococcus durans]MZG93834.1 hypothetical protein [Enterococcus durans]MZH20786.1 hypothetical protein [Enterococcus durans]MZH23521.1 hypothetical protein [Enterococcus durans]MZH26226.1 hypothetical protein [Enterococcus durans]